MLTPTFKLHRRGEEEKELIFYLFVSWQRKKKGGGGKGLVQLEGALMQKWRTPLVHKLNNLEIKKKKKIERGRKVNSQCLGNEGPFDVETKIQNVEGEEEGEGMADVALKERERGKKKRERAIFRCLRGRKLEI